MFELIEKHLGRHLPSTGALAIRARIESEKMLERARQVGREIVDSSDAHLEEVAQRAA